MPATWLWCGTKFRAPQVQRGPRSRQVCDSVKRAETELASAVQTLADRNAELRSHAAAIAERDQRITELRGEIEALEQENANYQEQVLRAYQKIKSDEAMVARAQGDGDRAHRARRSGQSDVVSYGGRTFIAAFAAANAWLSLHLSNTGA